jgi:phosphotransferase family enzyme
MIRNLSCLSEEQSMIVQTIITALSEIRQRNGDHIHLNMDMRLLAAYFERFLSELNDHSDWKVFVISSTHHTSNIILGCVPINEMEISERFVLKIEISPSLDFESLKSETAFYRLHQDGYFPSFLGFFCKADTGAIALEYLDGYQKFSSLLWQEDISKSDAHEFFVSILSHIRSNLFFSGMVEKLSVDDNWTLFNKLYLDRALSRLSGNNISDLHRLRRIALLRECTINDVVLPGPIDLLHMIAKEGKFIANYLPTEVGSIHGDLHFGNILIKKEKGSRRSREFAFVDPHFFQCGPLIYDFGKLHQSFVGHYEAIMRGTYVIENQKNDNFVLHFFEPPHYISYGEDLGDCINDLFFSFHMNYEVVHWRSVCTLSTGIHLMAAAPHHILQEEEAISLLLWGCFLTFTAFQKLKLESK